MKIEDLLEIFACFQHSINNQQSTIDNIKEGDLL